MQNQSHLLVCAYKALVAGNIGVPQELDIMQELSSSGPLGALLSYRWQPDAAPSTAPEQEAACQEPAMQASLAS